MPLDFPNREIEAIGKSGRGRFESRIHRGDDAGLQRAELLVRAKEIAALEQECLARLRQIFHHHLLDHRGIEIGALVFLLRGFGGDLFFRKARSWFLK